METRPPLRPRARWFPPDRLNLPPRRCVSYNGRMTIGLGFHCKDGIVLAVDSQYTGGIGKTSGPKIFTVHASDNCAVTIAAAGSAALAKRAVREFKQLLDTRIGSKATSIEELSGLMEDALCAVHAKHVYPAPPNERQVLDFWLLAAFWTPAGHALFRTDVTAVTPVAARSCIGIGSYLGDYLCDLMWNNPPLTFVEDVIPIAAHIIKCAKDYIDGCGLNTFIHVLTQDGLDERKSQQEIQDGEEFFESVFRSIRIGMEGLTNIDFPVSENVQSISVFLRALAQDFRDRQVLRRMRADVEHQC